MIRAFAGDRTVRVVIAEMRAAANRTREAHGLGADATRLAAEASICTALLSSQIKGDERITLQIQAEHPRFSFVGDIGADDLFRARFTPSDVRWPGPSPITGILLAIKSDARREIYRGHTAIRAQTLEQALAGHLVQSSQVQGILKIGVVQDALGDVIFCGGYLVERLPEHPEHPWITAAEFSERYGALADQPAEDVMTGMAFGQLAGSELEILEVRPIRWQCRCSREKVEATIGSLGVRELSEMIDEGGAEVTCDFCSTSYRIGVPRLRELIELYGGN